MNKIYLKARAKVNLSLEILNKREDNYHNIKSVFQKINLYDELYIEKTNTNKFEIESIGKSLGADVVPCFYNRALLAEGIGNEITIINTDFKYYFVIIKPDICCNTKYMYDLIDKRNKITKLDFSDIIIKGLQNNDIDLIANNLYNTFEDVQIEKDLIKNIKKELIKNGAIGSLLTGSGSCVYGIFRDKQIAHEAYNKLKANYECYICTSYNSSRENENNNTAK